MTNKSTKDAQKVEKVTDSLGLYLRFMISLPRRSIRQISFATERQGRNFRKVRANLDSAVPLSRTFHSRTSNPVGECQ